MISKVETLQTSKQTLACEHVWARGPCSPSHLHSGDTVCAVQESVCFAGCSGVGEMRTSVPLAFLHSAKRWTYLLGADSHLRPWKNKDWKDENMWPRTHSRNVRNAVYWSDRSCFVSGALLKWAYGWILFIFFDSAWELMFAMLREMHRSSFWYFILCFCFLVVALILYFGMRFVLPLVATFLRSSEWIRLVLRPGCFTFLGL